MEKTPATALAEVYLGFIQVMASHHDRTPGTLRTFLDTWFAYETGGPFLNRAGTPIWLNKPCPIKHRAALLAADWISDSAQSAIDNERTDVHLVKDHILPVRVIRERLFERQFTDRDELLAFLRRWYRIGIITKVEDVLLNQRGLNRSMPPQWDQSSTFERYRYADISGKVGTVRTEVATGASDW